MPEIVELTVPGDKSISHRALILSSLAEGTSSLTGVLDAADTRSTLSCLATLGCEVEGQLGAGRTLCMRGRGHSGWSSPPQPLDCGNSGTTARLLLGALAGQPLVATLSGDESLRNRPMRRVTEPLQTMGAFVEELGEADRLPVRIRGGRLRALRWSVPIPSAQVKSALLLAGLVGGVRVAVHEPLRTRDHTERLLRAMGCNVWQEGGEVVLEPPPHPLATVELTIPGDFSSAAFLLALGMLTPSRRSLRIRCVGVNPTRTAFLEVVQRMGGVVGVEPETSTGVEPVATLSCRHSSLRGTRVIADEVASMIDEVPILAVLAAHARGVTEIRGASELRVKESDRIAGVAQNLRASGIHVEEFGDGLRILGTPGHTLPDVHHPSTGDHRIAMAFGVLRAVAGEVGAEDDAAAVSFPGFWELIRRTTRALRDP